MGVTSPAYFWAVILGLLLALSCRRLISDSTSVWPLKNTTYDDVSFQRMIPNLIEDARNIFEEIISHETHNYSAAMLAYTRRRGMPAPPGFAAWYAYATDSQAIIVEEFWDQIYLDLEPFRKVPPRVLRLQTKALAKLRKNFVTSFTVSQGNTKARHDPDGEFLEDDLLKALKKIEHALPDLEFALSSIHSPRIMASWEAVHTTQEMDRHSGLLFQNSVPLDTERRPKTDSVDVRQVFDKRQWNIGTPPSDLIAGACPPKSNARILLSKPSSAMDTLISQSDKECSECSKHMSSVCSHPELINLHGALVRPMYQMNTAQLLPLFSTSPIAEVSQEITVPAPIYWTGDENYLVSNLALLDWSAKADKAFWRGTNNGGRHNATSWPSFHRHRFVALTNRTYIEGVENGKLKDWALLQPTMNQRSIDYAIFAGKYLDTGFVKVHCLWEPAACPKLAEHFEILPRIPLEETLKYKYIFDVDGTAFSGEALLATHPNFWSMAKGFPSGRFRTLLRSGSVVLKATIFREWHNSRLFAWKHFVPISSTFDHSMWETLQFFLPREPSESNMSSSITGNGEAGERIGREAREWAEKVLREEDMLLYLWRLLLEWARLTDDLRDVLEEPLSFSRG